MESGSDSDAPEELTAFEGIKQDEEIRKIQKENIIRVAKEGKERRRKWAQRITQGKADKQEDAEVKETEQQEEEEEDHAVPGMLPSNIVDFLAAREKQTFASDSEEEEEIIQQKPKKKRKQKTSGPETVILKDLPPAECLRNSLEFLKRRKMQVSRSTSVLKNADQALRLLSSRGSLFSKH
ncbi:uncharacterized protein LOC109717944 [Ananas comosus]|uniref:Uncharacterized protein LOC109717944 n=1 Tax=Ananas comosus TaxID=4615 RepID=A0A6P5FTA6_ANACO|nr:uncharacterized protein LOC109717944 [Ananas comosus]